MKYCALTITDDAIYQAISKKTNDTHHILYKQKHPRQGNLYKDVYSILNTTKENNMQFGMVRVDTCIHSTTELPDQFSLLDAMRMASDYIDTLSSNYEYDCLFQKGNLKNWLFVVGIEQTSLHDMNRAILAFMSLNPMSKLSSIYGINMSY